MSAGGYDGSRMSSDFARQQKQPPIRSSIPNRLPPAPPPPSRIAYDRRYAPDLSLREGMSSVHRPNNYRPDYSAGKYYPRSQSPDPYSVPPRHPEPDPWSRNNNVWRPPPESSNIWPDRKPIPASPTNSGIGRGLRDDPPPRSFEPSASWVNSRSDRSIRSDNSPSSDMYARRGKGSIDRSPERSRVERSPVYPSGDRYIPTYNTARRDSFTSSRPGYDSYRPSPSDHVRSAPSRRDPLSPASSHHRRDSGSYTARSLSRHDAPRISQGAPRKASPAPLPANSSTQNSSAQAKSASESWNYVTRLKHSLPPRPPSRSSIASTQVSARKSPVPTPTPPSASASTPASAPSPQTQTEPVQKTSPLPAATASAPVTKEPSLSANSLGPMPGEAGLTRSVEHTVPEQNGMDLDTKAVSDDSVVSIVVSPTGKQPSSISQIPTVAPENVPEEPTRHEEIQDASSQKAMEQECPAERHDVPASRPMSPLIIPTVAAVHESTLQDQEPLQITQPKASHPVAPSINSVEPVPAIDIPSPTHSPSPAVRSSVIADKTKPSPITPPVDIPDPEDIPDIKELKTAQDALRLVVMTRLVYDRQSREQRVNPVLMANLSIAAPMEVQPTASPEALLEKMSTGQALEDKMESFIRTRPKLASYLRQRHGMVEQKIARLRKEYKLLQDRWDVHCNKLNEQQKTLASEHEMQHGGRTTRRSTAITDAVRSDFEMEQIIASLGVDDATDPNCLSARNTAKIPDMISVVNGQIDYVFDDTAHRVEHPAEYYAPKTGIHDWTAEEKRIYLEKFAAYPKQFGIIADYLENKTAAQCVDYYYLHKGRFIDFRKVVSQFAGNKRRRRGTGKKKGNGLLADIAIHDMEVRGGAAAAAAAAGTLLSASISARAPRGRKTHPAAELRKPTSRRNAVQFEDTPTSTPTPEPEAGRTRRRRTVPSTPLASTPVVATPTPEPSTPAGGSVQQDDNLDELDTRPTKRPRRAKKIKSAATVDDTSPGPEGHVPLPGRPRKDKGPAVWTEHDKKTFVKLLGQYGDNFNRISELLPPKTPVQCSNYFANHKYELGLDVVIAKAPKRSPSPGSKSHLEQTPSSSTNAPTEGTKTKVPLPGKRNTLNQSAYTESGSHQPSAAFNKQTSRQRATATSGSTPVMNRLDRPSAEKRPSGYPFPHNAGSGDFAEDGYPYSAKGPTYAAMYPPAAISPDARSGYRPTTPVNTAPSDTPNIIHSPTGMSPPRPAPPPIPTMTQPYLPPHMHFAEQAHHGHGYYNVPVANPNWPVQPQQRYYDRMFVATGNSIRVVPAPRPAPQPAPMSASVSSPPVSGDGRTAAVPGTIQPEYQRPPGNPYPGYALPPGMLPPPGVHQQQPLPPPPVPYPPPPSLHASSPVPPSVTPPTRPMPQYYPGWTNMQ